MKEYFCLTRYFTPSGLDFFSVWRYSWRFYNYIILVEFIYIFRSQNMLFSEKDFLFMNRKICEYSIIENSNICDSF